MKKKDKKKLVFEFDLSSSDEEVVYYFLKGRGKRYLLQLMKNEILLGIISQESEKYDKKLNQIIFLLRGKIANRLLSDEVKKENILLNNNKVESNKDLKRTGSIDSVNVDDRSVESNNNLDFILEEIAKKICEE